MKKTIIFGLLTASVIVVTNAHAMALQNGIRLNSAMYNGMQHYWLTPADAQDFKTSSESHIINSSDAPRLEDGNSITTQPPHPLLNLKALGQRPLQKSD